MRIWCRETERIDCIGVHGPRWDRRSCEEHHEVVPGGLLLSEVFSGHKTLSGLSLARRFWRVGIFTAEQLQDLTVSELCQYEVDRLGEYTIRSILDDMEAAGFPMVDDRDPANLGRNSPARDLADEVVRLRQVERELKAKVSALESKIRVLCRG